MKRAVYLLYGIVGYLLSLATLVYAIGFVEAAFVPRSIDAGGPSAPLGAALLIDSRCSPSSACSTAEWLAAGSKRSGHASCPKRSSAAPTSSSRARV